MYVSIKIYQIGYEKVPDTSLCIHFDDKLPITRARCASEMVTFELLTFVGFTKI